MIDKNGEYVRAGLFVRSPYNYDTDEASRETGLTCPEKTLAQQQFREECDINTIVQRFGLTGQLPVNPRSYTYEDYSDGVIDYQSALNLVMDADREFMRLPAQTRARFENSPQQLMEFLSDSRNREEAEKLGFLKVTDPSNLRVLSPGPVTSSRGTGPGSNAPDGAVSQKGE